MALFRNEILHNIRDCLYELELHSTTPNTDNPDTPFYPLRPAGDSSDEARQPNAGYETPLWQTLLRPVRPQDIDRSRLVPSAFLKVISGERSVTGGGLKGSPVRSVLGEITEEYIISIQCIFRDGWGAVEDDSLPQAQWTAKPITEQVNGFVHDLDKCINVFNLRPRGADYNVLDVYLSEWQVLPAMEGTTDELFIGNIVVTANFVRNPQ